MSLGGSRIVAILRVGVDTCFSRGRRVKLPDLRPATLEPPGLRPVDLDQLAQTIAAVSRLMNRLQPGPAILPKTRRNHPLTNRLARKVNPMQLRELLRRQRRAKVRVTLPDDANGRIA